MTDIGPKYGYNPNPRKCVLILKNKETELEAQELFSEYGIKITTEGKHHLGAVIGTKEFKNKYMHDLVNNWVDDVKLLAEIAWSEPQSAYAAMVFAVQHRWKFAQRTIPEIAEHLKVLEFEIHHSLLPAIIGRDISNDERDILALPTRLGGLGISKLDEMAEVEYAASIKITNSLKDSIFRQEFYYPKDDERRQKFENK